MEIVQNNTFHIKMPVGFSQAEGEGKMLTMTGRF